MKIVSKVRGWRSIRKTKHRLRRLQEEYWRGLRGETEVIPEYISILARLRGQDSAQRDRRPSDPPITTKLHLGSGGHNIEGWINADLGFDSGMSLRMNAIALPFRSRSVDRIYCEDFLEHLEYEDAATVLGECRRVLRPSGAMRIGIPDLEAIVRRVYLERNPIDLDWCHSRFGDGSPCEALNRHMRMGGEHRFLYDWQCLSSLLRSSGFSPTRMAFHRTRFEEFRYLDLRGYGLSLFVEAVPESQSGD